jgi:hypothetical protein
VGGAPPARRVQVGVLPHDRLDADAARRNRAAASAILDALPHADAAQVRAWIAREAAAPPAAVLTPDPRSPAED